MSDTNDSANQAELRAQAAAWLVRVYAEDSRDEDWRELERWLAVSSARQRAFDAAESVWTEYDDPSVARAVLHGAAPVVVDIATRRRRPAAGRTWVAAGAAAAGLAAAIVVAGVLLHPFGPARQRFATAVGQTRLVRLADGSTVRLGADSHLEAWVGGGVRRVRLEAGEAEFEVAKDRAHPFVVQADDEAVTVVGTHFDVLADPGRVTVTVASGVVEVGASHPSAASATYRLLPGDQLRHHRGDAGSMIAKVSVDDALAWTKGYLVFHDSTLADVAAELGRYSAVPIRAEGGAASLRFSGVLMLDGDDAVLARLQRFLPIRVVHGAKEIVLQPS